MDKEDVKKLAENPNFIKGVYNYCDRWCERCPFTSRCMNFAMADEQFADPETQDLNNELFWSKLSETFKVTLELLQETAERQGIDLDALDTEESEEERLKDDAAKNHKCCRAARIYGEMVDDWFNSAKELISQNDDEKNLEERIGIEAVGPAPEDAAFDEATQVVRWYQYQIYVKLMRAVRGDMEEELEILKEFPRDSDGSAKVALIGIDRSIAGWEEIRHLVPFYSSAILNMQVHLEQLRREVEKIFPAAREFIRPGFDKIDLNS